MGPATEAAIQGKNIDPPERVFKKGSAVWEAIRGRKTPIEPVTTGEGQVPGRVFRGRHETGAISTITGKPVTEAGGGTFPEPPSLGTMFKAGFVDNPQTKIEIYSKARFPDLPPEEAKAKYGITEDGTIVFRDEDGIFKPETDATFVTQAKNLAGRTGASGPSIILSIIGSVMGGVPGTFMGGAAGEGFRKTIGAMVFDEPQSKMEIASDVALEGVLAATGEIGGSIFTGSTNKLLNLGKPGDRTLAKLATKDLRYATKKELLAAKKGKAGLVSPLGDIDELKRIQALADKYGIKLSAAEISKNRELLNHFSLLGDLDQSADLMQAFKRTQNLDIQNAVPRFLDSIADEADPFEVSVRAAKAADDAVLGLKGIRREAARPFYKKAFADDSIEIDINPILAFIDKELQQAKGPVRDSLLKAQSLLKKPITKVPPSKILTKEGVPAVPAGEAYDLSTKGLHGAKMALDDLIAGAKQTGVGNTSKGNYSVIRRMLLKEMTDQNPSYALANLVHALHSVPVDQVEAGVIGALSRMSSDNITGASTQILASKMSTPQLVQRAKFLIRSQDPGAWDAAVRDFLKFKFERIKDVRSSELTNIGGAFRQAVFGDANQRKIMEAALEPAQFKNLTDFMEVLQRTGLTHVKESATATRQETLKQFRRKTEFEPITIMTSPFRTPKRTIADRYNELRFGRGARELAEKIVDPKSAVELANMRRMSPKSEQLIKSLTIFMALTGPDAMGAKSAVEGAE